jgi:hypothetical protein
VEWDTTVLITNKDSLLRSAHAARRPVAESHDRIPFRSSFEWSVYGNVLQRAVWHVMRRDFRCRRSGYNGSIARPGRCTSDHR